MELPSSLRPRRLFLCFIPFEGNDLRALLTSGGFAFVRGDAPDATDAPRTRDGATGAPRARERISDRRHLAAAGSVTVTPPLASRDPNQTKTAKRGEEGERGGTRGQPRGN